MTDKELRDTAVAELKLTTVGWLKGASPRYPSGTAPAATHWGKAMTLLGQIGAVVVPPPPPPSASSLPLRGIYMIDGVTNWPDPTATALRQNLIILHAVSETARLNQLKTANPLVRVVPYFEWGMVCVPSWCTVSPWTLTQAQAGGWVANYNGGPAAPSGFPEYYGMDCGKAGYGLAWAQAAIARLGANAWNGVFLDDVNVTDNRFPRSWPDPYSSQTAYKDAVAIQLQAATDYIRSQGKISVANLGGLGSWSYEHMKDLQLYPDISMIEHFGMWSDSSVQSEGEILETIAALQNAVNLGKQVIGVANIASLSDTRRAHYADSLARVLGKFGTLILAVQPDYGNEYWDASFIVDHGLPTGPATHPSTAVWTRMFTDGTTLTVNTQTQTLTP